MTLCSYNSRQEILLPFTGRIRVGKREAVGHLRAFDGKRLALSAYSRS